MNGWILGLLIVFLAVFAVASWLSFIIVRFMVRVFLSDPTVTFEFSESEKESTTLPVGVEIQEFSFKSADGADLAGTLVRDPQTIPGPEREAETPHMGVVIFAPEFGGDQRTWLKYAKFIPESGYWLFTFDFRGTGKSPRFRDYVPRKWASDLEVLDMEAALEAVRSLPGVRSRKVCLFGISRGGLASLVVASKDVDCAGVVLEGSGSTVEVIHTYMRKWAKVYAPEWFCDAIPELVYRFLTWLVLRISEWRVGYRFPIIDQVPAALSKGPCLFIHGERDRHVDPEMAQRQFAAYPGAKELWMVPGARHNGAVLKQPEAYRQRVLSHLAKLTEMTKSPAP